MWKKERRCRFFIPAYSRRDFSLIKSLVMVMGSWLGKRRNQRSEPYCMEHTAHHHRLSMVEAFCLLDRIREREAREFCPQKAAGNEERDCLFELFSLSVLLVPRYILFRAAEIKRLSWETAYTHNIHAVDCYYNTTSKDQQQKSLSEQSKLSSSPSCWVMREKKKKDSNEKSLFSLCAYINDRVACSPWSSPKL